MYAPARILVLLSLGCALLGAGTVHGDDSTKSAKRKVIVNGSATVQVKADAAQLTFGVTTSNETSKATRDEHDKQVKRLREALAALEIKSVEVQAAPSAMGTVQEMARGLPAPGPAPKYQAQT